MSAISMRPLGAVMLAGALALTGCSNLNSTEQRALTGTVGGAGVGAILGAIGGNAGLGALAGAGAGLAGGLIYDHVKKEEAASYNKGYQAGRHHQRPQPPS
jgi:uncharacterized protein YcfJ